MLQQEVVQSLLVFVHRCDPWNVLEKPIHFTDDEM
jgi:hypothetical protein